MALTKRTLSITGAVLVSAGLIVGAFALSGPLPFVTVIRKADAQSTAELLKAYAAKDTDGDSLTDWEEALYGTDPQDPSSVQDGYSDAEAVAQGLVKPRFVSEVSVETERAGVSDIPGTVPAANSVTEQFARALFKNYMTSRNNAAPPTQEEIVTFVTDAVTDLKASQADELRYAVSDVKTVADSTEALRTYIAEVENVFSTYPTEPGLRELEYIAAAVNNNDVSALPKARAIGKSHIDQAGALMKLSVPHSARLAHLGLANSMYRLGTSINDMAAIDTDPLRGMLGMIDYQPASQQSIRALAAYDSLIASAGISYTRGEAGYFLRETARSMAETVTAGEPAP